MANIQLNDETITILATKAILETITPDMRTKIIENAVAKLLTPERPQYSSGPAVSPIQQMFSNAIERVARDVIEKMIAENVEVRAKIDEMAVATFRRVFEDPERLARMADVFSRAMLHDR